MILWTLVLGACASTIQVGDRLPLSCEVPDGYGTVFGSILMSVPTGISGSDQREAIDSLQRKKCRATIGRYIAREWPGVTTHPGDKYETSFEVGIERYFVLCAPAGTYSFQEIMQVDTGWLDTVGSMAGVANFSVQEGSVTYVGQLNLVAGFKSANEQELMIAMETADGVMVLGVPERFIKMNCSVADRKEETLRALGAESSGSIATVGTDLMFVDRRNKWHVDP